MYKTALFVITLLRICPHLKARAAEKCSLWLGTHMPSKSLEGLILRRRKGTGDQKNSLRHSLCLKCHHCDINMMFW